MSSGYILGITRGHNGGACLVKDGEIVFAIEEERLTRLKYDGGPLASIILAREHVPKGEKLDYLVVAHTQRLDNAGVIDYSGDDMYTGLCRKIGLLEDHPRNNNDKIIDLADIHHKLHAACAFYRSGFDKAIAVIIDGAGTFSTLQSDTFINGDPEITFEVESIIECEYPSEFTNLYKHHGLRNACKSSTGMIENDLKFSYKQPKENFTISVTDKAGIVKCYESVTEYCGFQAIEAGKTMGLFPYGKPDDRLPPLFDYNCNLILSNRNAVSPQYPQTGYFNSELYEGYKFSEVEREELSKLENRKNAAYWVQTETQKAAAAYIRKAYEQTGQKNIVVSGGYGLNCVANYFYREELKDLIDEGVNIYCEPISSDAGTAIGAALIVSNYVTKNTTPMKDDSLYLGPQYNYSENTLNDLCETHLNQEFRVDTNIEPEDVADILSNRNIVTMFQGRSENGPRALGNRSILYDPSDPDGKDFVNTVKNREFFRPFAGSVLEEDAHDWFDLKGLDTSPHMMYAVNVKEDKQDKIKSITHVDGTCRIQTVNRDQNPHYYDLIKAFKEKTNIPMVFNTSFNLGGEPLVETLEDAIKTLAKSEINYMYLPELKQLLTITTN
tara:strand:- start:2840 stop:4675 length:1836 start_codon:yes stop_codon:yes gene_type:complete